MHQLTNFSVNGAGRSVIWCFTLAFVSWIIVFIHLHGLLLYFAVFVTSIIHFALHFMWALNDETKNLKLLMWIFKRTWFFILQEIEEKAPLLKKQREDYETALQNLEQMTAQLDSVMLVRQGHGLYGQVQ